MKQQNCDQKGSHQSDPPVTSTGVVFRAPGGRVVSLEDARRAAEAPTWETVESHLQSGKHADRVGEWQRTSPPFASALRVLRSLESTAGDPSPAAARSSRRAPSWLLRAPSDRQSR